jgi:PKHD-type hydroxylase
MRYNTIYNNPIRRSTVTEPWCYWDNAFTDEELQNIIEYCESKEMTAGTTIGMQDIEEVEKIRKSKIGFHQRSQETSWIFDRVNFVLQSSNEMFYGFTLNGYDHFQYTTYDSEKNGNYDWHMDTLMGESSNQYEVRKLSMTLLLNDDFEGGEFQLNLGNQNTPITLPAKKGRALLFPSFMCHTVTPVIKGIRKSLVVWCLGPKFT